MSKDRNEERSIVSNSTMRGILASVFQVSRAPTFPRMSSMAFPENTPSFLILLYRRTYSIVSCPSTSRHIRIFNGLKRWCARTGIIQKKRQSQDKALEFRHVQFLKQGLEHFNRRIQVKFARFSRYDASRPCSHGAHPHTGVARGEGRLRTAVRK